MRAYLYLTEVRPTNHNPRGHIMTHLEQLLASLDAMDTVPDADADEYAAEQERYAAQEYGAMLDWYATHSEPDAV